MISLSLLPLLLTLTGIRVVRAATTQAAEIASLYGLTSSTSFPFPTATMPPADTATFLSANHGTDPWAIAKKNKENQVDLSFVVDPFDTSDTSNAVLQVLYPANSFGGTTGGAQFINLFPNPNDTDITSSDSFQTMLLSYEVAFDPDFQWVKGGKLPGLRGGPDLEDCDGGQEPKGNDCFSARLMWRANGTGEVYAYVRTQDGLCNEAGILCDTEFGTSIDRGAYTFAPGVWNKISLMVRLNFPVNTANGDVQLYYNDQLMIHQTDIQFRNSPLIASVGGVFFSTFFGGDDATWESPTDQHSYYRNIQLWGSTSPSNSTGKVVSAATARISNVGLGSMLLPLIAGLGITAVTYF